MSESIPETAVPGGPPPRRWPWIVVGALLVFLVLAAVVLPLLLDVERHRERIERALGDATGWEATLGEIDLSVLSGLSLTVSPAGLAAPGDASSFEVEEITVHAALMPLLRGKLEIESVNLLRTDMTLVRPNAERGWVLPLPQSGPPPTGSDQGSAGVSIGRIEVRDGSLRLEDRAVDPPLTLAVDDVDVELFPATGRMRGGGAFAGEGGRIAWDGSLADGVEISLENLSTDILGPWLGGGVLHPGGRLAGDISVDSLAGVAGKLTGESLRVLAGATPLPSAELDFSLVPQPGGWGVENLELIAGRAKLVGTGTLVPLSLQIQMPATSLETALELTEALFPLGLDVSPPGSAQLAARVEMPEGQELVYEATGELSAARFVAADILPEAIDVRAAFELSRKGELGLQILNATVGGGPLEGRVEIDSIDPMGTLNFEGRLAGASLGELLGGFVAEAAQRVTGPADVDGQISIDFNRPTLDASSIRGRLALAAQDVSMAGWDLESAFRDKLREKLGKLAEIAALVDSEATAAREEQEDPLRRLLDRIAAEIRIDELPWALPTVELRAGQVSAQGQGSFDPVEGRVDLLMTAKLDPELTQEYVGRYSQLRAVVDDEGRLSLPMRLRGPMTQPAIELELSGLIPGVEPKEAIKGLLKGILDRETKDD